MKTLEDDLKSQPRRHLPPDWKAEILANAAGDLSSPEEGSLRWLVPTWLRYGVAALWIVTLTLHFMTPRSKAPASLASAKPATTVDGQAVSWLLAKHNYPYDDLIY